MAYNLDSYFVDLDEITNYLMSNPFVTSSDFFYGSKREIPKEIQERVERAYEYRGTIIDNSDLERISPFLAGTDDEELRERNKVYFTFTWDLQDWQKEKSLRNKCKPYEKSDPIFQETKLWERLTTNDQDLVELTRDDEIEDEIIKIKENYYRTDGSLNPSTIRFLKSLFHDYPESKLWLRLSGGEKYSTKPLKILNEEAIIPAEKAWWKKLELHHNGKRKVAEYQNIDISLPTNQDRYWDKKVRGIDKLQVEWHRKNPDSLSMMMEELPERWLRVLPNSSLHFYSI